MGLPKTPIMGFNGFNGIQWDNNYLIYLILMGSKIIHYITDNELNGI